MQEERSFSIEHDNARFVFAEICVGYGLTLSLIAVLFGMATGFDIEVPWEVFVSITLIAAGLGLTALRIRRNGQISTGLE